MLFPRKVSRITLAWLAVVWMASPAPAEDRRLPSAYLQMVESKPVLVHQAEFVAVTAKEWSNRNGGGHGEDPLEVQLRITNRSAGDLLFNLFDTFAPILKDAEGNKMQATGGRDGTRVPKPVLISPGTSYCLCRAAKLMRDRDGRTVSFVYEDGTGAVVIYRQLRPGKYRLSFSFQNEEKEALAQSKRWGGLPVWAGNVTTQEVEFEVVEPINS